MAKRGRPNKTQAVLNQLKTRPRKDSPNFGEFVLPNNSGDHRKSIKRDEPTNDYDLANKKYVDDEDAAADSHITSDGTSHSHVVLNDTHRADNTQAHSDYMLNTGDTSTGNYNFGAGTITTTGQGSFGGVELTGANPTLNFDTLNPASITNVGAAQTLVIDGGNSIDLATSTTAGNITSTGTIQAEQLTSTDDASIYGNKLILGAGAVDYFEITRSDNDGRTFLEGGTAYNQGAHVEVTGKDKIGGNGKGSVVAAIGKDSTSKFQVQAYILGAGTWTSRFQIDGDDGKGGFSSSMKIGGFTPARTYGTDRFLEIEGTANPALVIHDTGQAQPYHLVADGDRFGIVYGTTALMRVYNSGNMDVLTGSIASASLTQSAVGPTNNLDVSGVNTVWIDCSSNSVTIGGFVGGVDGQVLHIARKCTNNSATLEHIEGTGNQDIYLHAGADETLSAEYGGWVLVCDGSNWYDLSHAKHV